MAGPTQIDQVTQGLNRLLEQFKNKPNIEGILRSYLTQLNDLEDSYFSLLNDRNINVATGVNLDILGALVGEPRLGRSDADYRIAIITKIGVNNSEGTPEQIFSLLQTLTGATLVKIWEHYPVSAVYSVDVAATAANLNLADSIQPASPATSGSVAILFNPGSTGFTPTEQQVVSYFLVDENGDFIVDENGDYIIVTQIEPIYTPQSILAEFDDTDVGILVEASQASV